MNQTDSKFQPLNLLVGSVLVIVGVVIMTKVRLDLKRKAGFSNLTSTKIVQVVDGHQLITDGLFSQIRHPLYLGFLLMLFGITIIFASLLGAVLIAISVVFILIRIRIEEEMLTQTFGEAYREYQGNTKKLIPYIY